MSNPVCSNAYPLTALQEGMLFHHISEQNSAKAYGVDIEQISIQIDHDLNQEKFVNAWLRLLSHHEVMRTAFSWGANEDSQQLVFNSIDLPITQYDWQDLDVSTYSEKLDLLQDQDRLIDFDLSQPPLMRLAIIKGPDNSTFCLWTFHHILLDGRSFPLLLNELFEIYEASILDVDFQLRKRRSFSQYVDWFKNRDTSDESAFWARELGEIYACIALNFDSEPVVSDSKFDFKEACLDDEQTKQLTAFANSSGVTVNTLLQTAWALMLHHYTRETEIVFGSTRACRYGSVAQAEQIIGMMINTVPFRVQLDNTISLIDLLQSVRAKHLKLRDYEFSPLQDIRKIAGIRSESIFESLVVYESYSLQEKMQEAGGQWLQRNFKYRGQTNFPLALIAYGGDQLQLRLEFKTTRFNQQVISGLLCQLQTLLLNFYMQSQRAAVDVDYLSETQKKALVHLSPKHVVHSRNDTCIHGLFEQQVRFTPNQIALSFEQQSMTYSELNQRANHVAKQLIDNNVQIGDLVGLCIDRSMQLIVGLLGILKSGAAYVPLDPDYPEDRLAYILKDAGINWVLSKKEVAERLSFDGIEFLWVDELQVASAFNNPQLNINPQCIAYVIYTSGSTGKPKGVKVRHDNIGRLFHSTQHCFNFNENDVWTLFHSTAFDFSVWEIWGALITGGRLLIVPFWVSRSPDKFHALVLDESVTVLNQTPSAFRQFIEVEQQQEKARQNALRYVIFGGEALDLQSLQPWFEIHGDQKPKLVNMYGITETTVHVTYRPITQEDLHNVKGSVIGEAIPDLYIYLLDDSLKPVPNGIVGEMYVGGAGVTAGYLNREALTKQRFIQDPYGRTGLLYKTGDLARRLFNGELEYMGRSDLQVKVRGFRIETGEIESALNNHPWIKQSIVDVTVDANNERRLFAYVLYNESGVLPVSDIRDFLLESLPDYMVPGLYMTVSEIPLTHNGKINRRALPEPDFGISRHSDYIAPKNEHELLLVSIWSKALNIKKIGVNDNFFDLGGDSILTIKIIVSLRERGYQITPKQIFNAKTIAGLADLLEKSSLSTVSQTPVLGHVPLLPIQHWFFANKFAQADYWNQSFLFNLSEVLDIECLKQAFSLLLQHHDALRARFELTENGWIQNFTDSSEFPSLVKFDLCSLTGVDQGLKISEHCIELQSSLNINKGPGLVAAYFKAANGPDKLFICVHHLLVDGVSWSILLQDLEILYKAAISGQVAILSPKTDSLRTWIKCITEYAQSPVFRNNLSYWQNLDDSGIETIAESDASKRTENNTGSIALSLSTDETDLLLTSSNFAYNTKINDLLLTGLSIAINKWKGLSCILIDVEGHGREDLFEDIDVSRTIGWFTTIYPLLLDLDSTSPLSVQIQLIKEQVRKIPNNGFDFLVAKYLSGQGSIANTPDAEIMFNYLGQFDHTVADLNYLSFAKEEVGAWHGSRNHCTHDFEFLGWIRQGRLQFSIHYNLNTYSQAEIQSLATAFQQSLIAIVEHCNSVKTVSYTPSDFSLISVSQHELNHIASTYKIKDLYPLSPMQTLFYTADLLDPAHGFEQWHFELKGNLDCGKYRMAWQAVIDKHDILRTAILELNNGDTVQVVCTEVELDWTIHDLTNKDGAEQRKAIIELKKVDKQAHFSLEKAPLLRVNLFKLQPECYELIWSTHHLCIDGWSWPLVFADVANFYLDQNANRLQAAQYGDYIRWLKRQTPAGIRTYWQTELKGFKTPILFARNDSLKAQEKQQTEHVLSQQISRELEEISNRFEITLSTLIQAIWTLVLGRAGQTEDVVFGFSSAGRPAEVASVGMIVGPFVNNIPKRVVISKAQELAFWLQSIQDSSLTAVQFEFASPLEIQQFCGLPLDRRLFETLLVFQNYDLSGANRKLSEDIDVQPIDLPQATNYPLTLVVVPGDKLSFTAYTHGGYFTDQDIDGLFADIDNAIDFFSKQGAIKGFLKQDCRWQINKDSANSAVVKLSGQSGSTASSIEQLIGDIWAKTFALERVDIHQSFFDMGGQSVQLVAIHGEIQKALNKRFPITRFFKHPTVKSLAAYLDVGEQKNSIDGDSIKKKVQMKKAIQRKKRARVRK